MAKRLLVSLLLTGCALSSYPRSWACSVDRVRSPEELYDAADAIVRVTASKYLKTPAQVAQEQKEKETEWTNGEIQFEVEEVLKGSVFSSTLIVSGRLDDQDDYNDRPVPYDLVRPSGRGGMCHTWTYKKGGEFLLFLRKGTVGGELTPYWAPLAPTNEQIRPDEDDWLVWVKHKHEESERGKSSEVESDGIERGSLLRWLSSLLMAAI